MHILIVDDEPLIVSVIEDFLKHCGHMIITANAVMTALGQIENTAGKLDLVITDICMPGSDGVVLLDQVRQRYPDVDVILLTAFAETMNAKTALHKGASAFLRKPVSMRELESIVAQVAEKRKMRGQLVRTQDSYAQERQQHEVIVRERMLLRNLHRRLLPKTFDWLRRSTIHIRYMAMAGVGGDYVDVRPYGKTQTLIFLADVAGHGLTAAFACSAFKAWFLELRHGLQPPDILGKAQALLCDLLPEEFLVTAFCGIYEEREGMLTYASAGHVPPFVLASNYKGRVLEADGPALGALESPAWESRAERLLAGEALVLYTDGLVSDPTPLLEPLGRFQKDQPSPAEAAESETLLTRVVDTAVEALPTRAFSDDLTILTLGNRGKAAALVPSATEQIPPQAEIEKLSTEWIDCVITSSPACLDILTRYLAVLSSQPVPAEAMDDVVYCIREMAGNAIEWGNHYHPDLRVRISTVVLDDRVLVRIEDEGGGFDPQSFLADTDIVRQQEEREITGKRDGGFGLRIVQDRMDDVNFNRKGNTVLLTRYTSTETANPVPV